MKRVILYLAVISAAFMTCACSDNTKNTDNVPYPTSRLSAQDADISSQSEHIVKIVSEEIAPDEKAESPYVPTAPENIEDFFASAANAVLCKITDVHMVAFGVQEDDNPPDIGDMRCVLTAEVQKAYADTPLKFLSDGKSIVVRYNNAINQHYNSEYDFKVGDKCFLIISEEKPYYNGVRMNPQEFIDEYPYYMYYDCGAVIEQVGKKYNAYTLMELYEGRKPEYDKDKRTRKLYSEAEIESVLTGCSAKMRNISAYELFEEITNRKGK